MRLGGSLRANPPAAKRRTKLVLVCQFFPPEPFSGANRVSSLADALGESSDVVVVTLQPSYPDPAYYDAESTRKTDQSLPYRIKRVFALERHPRSLLKRAFREQAMALRLALASGPGTPVDALITSSPSMFLGPAVLLAAKLRSVFFVWDIRDITWQLAEERFSTSFPRRVAAKFLERVMWETARRADMILAATEGSIELLVSKGVARDKIMYAPNAISGRLLEAFGAGETQEVKSRPLVAYVGLLGYPQGVGVLLDAAAVLRDVDFQLVGDGPERASLGARAESMGLTNVRFTGFLGREGLRDVYRRSDILFAQLKDSPTLNSATIPSKLFEYMAAGRPFIYGGKGLAADLLAQIGCAVIVPPNEPQELVRAIQDLLGDRSRMRELGRKGTEHVEHSLRREDIMRQVAEAVNERVLVKG
jgi:putative colanic acid biosynthesis glycosyltransferase WcaI